MSKLSVACLILLMVSFSLPLAIAQTGSISPTDTFPISTLNSKIQFAVEVSYTSATLEGNTWYFNGLHASGKGGYPINGHLHISANNCTVCIAYLQAWAQPEIGAVGLQWIKYRVTGSGTQTLDTHDLFPDSTKWTKYTVIVNGKLQEMGDTWNLSDTQLLTINTLEPSSTVELSVYHESLNSSTAPLPAPQPPLHNFTLADNFEIPACNGTFSFGVPGSFDEARLDGAVWNFVNLTLNSCAINAGVFAPNVTGRDVLPYILQAGYPATLGFSVEDCKVRITSITPLTWHYGSPELNYTVQGCGSQTLTLPYRLSDFNWTVYIDGVARLNGDGWIQTSDYQLKITNATSNVSVRGIMIPKGYPPILYQPPIFIWLGVGAAVLLSTLISIRVLRRKRAHSKKKQ
jgi:hypothetical protein